MRISKRRGAIVMSIWAGLTCLGVVGCQMSARGPAASTSTAPSFFRDVTAEKGGAELWAQTCSHCHNLRSPSSFGPAQWEVAVYDMRVRANLTGEEQRKILAFLKSASE